ncbi:MAG: radical SAM protein [Candidatus Omnitrophica bacterium]|nr:radical SAM protein [Candidatus Omnitrophota bacterium]
MKKALLVKPKDSYSYAVIPNLGLGYLAASLRKHGFEACILDCNKKSFDPQEFVTYLKANNFHLIGFQVYTNSLLSAKLMMETAEKALPEAIILIGGPHPSGDPGHALRFFSEADCAVVGEGEEAVVALMSFSKSELRDVSLVSRISNVAFRDSSEGVDVNEVRFCSDLDQIPDPAWDLIDPRAYPISPHGTFSKSYPVAPLITSRGCPYLCTFCAGFKSTGRKLRRRSVKSVLNEINYLYTGFGVREFHIEDDNFTLQKEYVMEFCEGLRSKGLNIWWACPNGIRADKLDKEMLVKMEESGCYSFALGIESGSDRVLKMMKKNVTVEEIERQVSLIKDTTKINITGFFLIGYPGESEEDIRQTIKFSQRLRIDKASFSPVMPLPGSELYDIWKKKINTDSPDWGKFLYYQIVPQVSEIDDTKLNRYLKKAVLQFYLRPNIIMGILKEIKTAHQLKVLLKRARTVLFGS